MKLSTCAAVISILTLSSVAFAALSKSDVKKEANEAASAATAGIKTACGCDIPISYEWGDFEKMTTDAYTSESKPRSWRDNFVGEAKAAHDAATKLCINAPAKAKYCSIKKITIVGKGVSETAFSYAAGSGVKVFTSEQAMLGDTVVDRIKQAVDIAAPEVGNLSKADVKMIATAEGVSASKAVSASCGCDMPVTYEWGDFDTMTTDAFTSESKPRSWKNNFVAEAKGVASAASLCTDAASKKKFCALKRFTIIGKGVSDTDFKTTSTGVQIYTSEQAQLGEILVDRIKSAAAL